MKQLEVTILGQSYRLGCPPGGEAQLLAAVATVDAEMSAIRDAGRIKARERIAVLAAPRPAPISTSTLLCAASTTHSAWTDTSSEAHRALE